MDLCENKKDAAALVIDIATPNNAILSAYYKRSFAYHTVNVRLPVILTQIIDGLVRSKEKIVQAYGDEGTKDLKHAIAELSKLKYEIQTNKPIAPLLSQGNDIEEYNAYIKKELDRANFCTYYSTRWLFSECYMYRRIAEIFSLTNTLSNFDYFGHFKEDSFISSLDFILPLAENLKKINDPNQSEPSRIDLKDDFLVLLKLNLWGNKCDLSLSGGKPAESAVGLLDQLQEFNKFILCDQSEEIYDAICQDSTSQIIDIICDNAGYEVFTDLCLADFLITHNFAKTVRFFVKTVPWFISDVTKRDLSWILDTMCNSNEETLQNLGLRWKEYFANQVWTIEESPYWTTHFDFAAMYEKDTELYRKLSLSKFAFYKGDLNYRKLIGGTNWDPRKPFEEALRGFHPSPLCALRTLKSDLICGLAEGVAEKAAAESKDWLITGNYGVIQFCAKVRNLP